MPDLLIRGVDPAVIQRLKNLALIRGTSLQVEAKRLVESSSKMSREEFAEIAELLRERTKGRNIDVTALIRETRDA